MDEELAKARATGVLLIQNGEYVLQHRDDKPNISSPGSYDIWGGQLEEGETPEEGAVRELLEETGVKAKANELKKLTDYKATGMGPETFGELIHLYAYVLELPNDVVVKCYEGQGIVKLPVGQAAEHPKLNDFCREAIEIYEAELGSRPEQG